MRVPVALLASMMLVFGSINTIATKIQDNVVVGTDAHGKAVLFKHPAVQTCLMFAGEALCLIPFLIRQWLKPKFAASDGSQQLADGPTASKAGRFKKAIVAFTLPALCDAGATTLLNLGLFYTYASVFQMLRGTLVVFAGVLTIVLLRRRLHSHNWVGMVLITAGAALVGASSIIYDKRDGKKSAPDPLLGNLLVVAAQLLNAAQFIVEERFLKELRPPVLLAVGAEGLVGLALCSMALPVLSLLPGPGGAPVDDAAAGIKAIAEIFTLQWTTCLTVLSIAAFNFFGVSVTKRLSGANRAAIDACRTGVVWLFSLRAGWEKFHMLQVVGFVVLVAGTSIYNDILRSCLPPPPVASARRAARHHRHHHRRQQAPRQYRFSEESDAERALLSGGESDSDTEDGMDLVHSGPPSHPPHAHHMHTRIEIDGAGPSTSAKPENVAAAEAYDEQISSPEERLQEQYYRDSGRPPVPRSSTVPTRSSAMAAAPSASSWGMARTLTMNAGVLSPHSLGSVPSDLFMGFESVPSSLVLQGMYTTEDETEEDGEEESEAERESHLLPSSLDQQ